MVLTAHQILLLQSLLFFWLTSCSGAKLNNRTDQSTGKDSDSTDSDRDMEDPQNITGSYLTSSCGPALNQAHRFKDNMDAYIYGCQIHNQSREKYLGQIDNFKAQFELKNGQKTNPALVIAAEERESWSFLLAFDKTGVEHRENDIKLIDLSFDAANKIHHVQDSKMNFIPSAPAANVSGSLYGLTMFVSSQEFDGNLGGLIGADRKCNDLAKAVQLDGEFMAVISQFSSPPQRDFFTEIKRQDSVYNIRGKKIADNALAMFTAKITLQEAINITEKNSSIISTSATAWTGTFTNGTASALDCSAWESADQLLQGSLGQITAKTRAWIENNQGPSTSACQELHRIYCISK